MHDTVSSPTSRLHIASKFEVSEKDIKNSSPRPGNQKQVFRYHSLPLSCVCGLLRSLVVRDVTGFMGRCPLLLIPMPDGMQMSMPPPLSFPLTVCVKSYVVQFTPDDSEMASFELRFLSVSIFIFFFS